jgi:hypothetical protein
MQNWSRCQNVKWALAMITTARNGKRREWWVWAHMFGLDLPPSIHPNSLTLKHEKAHADWQVKLQLVTQIIDIWESEIWWLCLCEVTLELFHQPDCRTRFVSKCGKAAMVSCNQAQVIYIHSMWTQFPCDSFANCLWKKSKTQASVITVCWPPSSKDTNRKASSRAIGMKDEIWHYEIWKSRMSIEPTSCHNVTVAVWRAGKKLETCVKWVSERLSFV